MFQTFELPPPRDHTWMLWDSRLFHLAPSLHHSIHPSGILRQQGAIALLETPAFPKVVVGWTQEKKGLANSKTQKWKLCSTMIWTWRNCKFIPWKIHPKDLKSPGPGELADHFRFWHYQKLIISTFPECFQDGKFQHNHPSITSKIIFQFPENPQHTWDGFACHISLEIQQSCHVATLKLFRDPILHLICETHREELVKLLLRFCVLNLGKPQSILTIKRDGQQSVLDTKSP